MPSWLVYGEYQEFSKRERDWVDFKLIFVTFFIFKSRFTFSRLIEALVLRHINNHEQRMLNARLSKVASETSESTSGLTEISRSLSKVTAELDRSSKLLQTARSALSPSLLRSQAPRTWEIAIGEGMELDAKKEAGNVDPGLVGAGNSSESQRAIFAWPIEQSTPLSHVVAFGRRLVDEVARRRKLDFRLTRVESIQE